MTLFRTTGLLSALALGGFVAWINFVQLTEAYGSGPPYFGRTTNMDKWSDPLPGLLMIDALVLLLMVVAVQLFRRRAAERLALESALD